jgi:hypothetical protein
MKTVKLNVVENKLKEVVRDVAAAARFDRGERASNLFFCTRRQKKTGNFFKRNYLVNQVPQASASRARFNPAGGMAMEE